MAASNPVIFSDSSINDVKSIREYNDKPIVFSQTIQEKPIKETCENIQNMKNLELYCPENYKSAKTETHSAQQTSDILISEPKLSPKTSPWISLSSQPSPGNISENVRFTNKYMIKPRKPDVNANIFINNEDHTIHSAMRWRDVKTGLVKDRSISYLKPEYFSPNSSPRVQKRVLITTPNSSISTSQVFQEKDLKRPPRQKPTELVFSTNNKYLDGPVPWRKEERKKNVKSPVLNLLTVSGESKQIFNGKI